MLIYGNQLIEDPLAENSESCCVMAIWPKFMTYFDAAKGCVFAAKSVCLTDYNIAVLQIYVLN